MPQMRAVMSGASVEVSAPQEGLEEARRLEDFEFHVGNLPFLDLHEQGTLAFDAGQVIDFDRESSSAFMRFALPAERVGVGVEAAEGAQETLFAHSEFAAHPRTERAGVRSFHRTIAAVAAAVVGGADRAAAGVSDRPQAWRAVRDHHADRAAQFALDADAVRRSVRLAVVEKGADDFDAAGAC